jgi:hypothetical protein
MTSMEAPWDFITWCIAREAARISRIPGAWCPSKWLSQATHQGSLMGAADQTRSPMRDITVSVNSANQFGMSALRQPPLSASGCGSSQ